MMTGLRNRKLWTAAIAASATIGLLAQAPAPAQPPAPATAPAGGAQPAVAQGLGPTQAAPVDRYVVGQAKAPAVPGKTTLDMTLDQAMQRALDKNLNLKAARFNPQSVDYQLLAARAVFTPTFTGTYSYQSSDRLNNNNLENAGDVTTKTQQFNGGASMPLPWHGASVNANFTNSRAFSNSTQLILNPSFSSGLQLQFTQPILQGFRLDSNRNTIRTLQVQRQITDTQLVATIENTKAQVRTAYWNLKQAIESIEIEQRALDLANQLYRDNQTKVEIGTLAPIDTVQNESSIAQAKQALLNAQITWQNAEISLDQLIADGPDDDVFMKYTINPTEQPVLAAGNVDIAAAVKGALANRTDLVEARQNLDVSKMNLDLTHEALRPTLNLTAQYSATGQGGTAISQGSAVAGGGGYTGAVGQVFRFQIPTWSTAFNFTYPLGMAGAKANYARAQIGIEQSQAQLKASELSVSSTVTAAGLAVQNSYLQYQAALAASDAQQRTTDAEETRYQVGTSTNYNVVQQQDALTQARLTELQRLIAYLEAVAQFDLVQKVGNQ